MLDQSNQEKLTILATFLGATSIIISIIVLFAIRAYMFVGGIIALLTIFTIALYKDKMQLEENEKPKKN